MEGLSQLNSIKAFSGYDTVLFEDDSSRMSYSALHQATVHPESAYMLHGIFCKGERAGSRERKKDQTKK